MNNEEIIPQYDIVRQNYTPEEKVLLGEIRENLVDLAISSGENFQANEEGLLNDIRNFIFLRLKGENQDNYVSNEYLDRLSRKFLRDINGYGEIDPLIQIHTVVTGWHDNTEISVFGILLDSGAVQPVCVISDHTMQKIKRFIRLSFFSSRHSRKIGFVSRQDHIHRYGSAQ